ncbi:MAG: hypothetical protein F4X92_07355 [Gammaproteobacteria bacterium]|nr:hypothetical protein [Gammaproteobacteria bacterium]
MVAEIRVCAPGGVFIEHFIYVAALFVLGASALFGSMIAMANTRHGPVRLHISGRLLPAFVITIIRYAFPVVSPI